MQDNIFLDSNLWVYLYSNDERKANAVLKLIRNHFKNIILSSQVLNECFNALTRKKIVPLLEARDIVNYISNTYPIISIDKILVQQAIQIHLTYHYSYYDSLIIATALKNQCTILYSEDMQHKQNIEQSLKIINPFE